MKKVLPLIMLIVMIAALASGCTTEDAVGTAVRNTEETGHGKGN